MSGQPGDRELTHEAPSVLLGVSVQKAQLCPPPTPAHRPALLAEVTLPETNLHTVPAAPGAQTVTVKTEQL